MGRQWVEERSQGSPLPTAAAETPRPKPRGPSPSHSCRYARRRAEGTNPEEEGGERKADEAEGAVGTRSTPRKKKRQPRAPKPSPAAKVNPKTNRTRAVGRATKTPPPSGRALNKKPNHLGDPAVHRLRGTYSGNRPYAFKGTKLHATDNKNQNKGKQRKRHGKTKSKRKKIQKVQTVQMRKSRQNAKFCKQSSLLPGHKWR